MKVDFENPKRYGIGWANPYGDSEEMSINEQVDGGYVSFYTYCKLLEEYKELRKVVSTRHVS